MSKPKDITQKTFQPYLLVVLAKMTEWTAGAPVYGDITFRPVCDLMGIAEDAWGIPQNHTTLWTHRLIGFAMRNLRNRGLSKFMERGVWTLTEAGVEEARSAAKEMFGEDLEAEDLKEVVTELESVTTELETQMARTMTMDGQIAQVLELESVPVKETRHPYSDDVYFVSLAISQTSCFGAFANKSPICRECPLQAECVGALAKNKSALAAQFEAKETEARRKEEAREAERQKRDQSVDELMDLLGEKDSEDLPDSSEGRTSGTAGRATVPSGKKAVKSKTQRAALCHYCSGSVPPDEESWWIKGVGVFHLECLEVPSKQ